MKPDKLKYIFCAAAVLWAGLIFYMSAQTAGESSSLSGGVIKGIVSLLHDFEKIDPMAQASIIEELQFIIRKSAHFLIYMVLGVFVSLACSRFTHRSVKCGLISLLICAAYAASDEVHQLFVAGRSCEFRDFIIDSAGSVLGIVAVVLTLILLSRVKAGRVQRSKHENS